MNYIQSFQVELKFYKIENLKNFILIFLLLANWYLGMKSELQFFSNLIHNQFSGNGLSPHIDSTSSDTKCESNVDELKQIVEYAHRQDSF